MTQPGVFTPYSTVPWKVDPPGWIPPSERARLASYQIYDQVYWSHIDTTYKVLSRDQNEQNPIYVPAARIIVEAVNRYVGKGLTFAITETVGSPTTRKLAEDTITALFRRERFYSKYDANKRFGLVRGDWMWHLLADPAKPQGSRLSLIPVDPASYFPVYESDIRPDGNPDKLVKVHLAERIQRGETFVVRRQTYEKATDEATGRTTIWSSLAIFEEDAWYDGVPGGEIKMIEMVTKQYALPADITAIPVYHIPNFSEPGNPFGSSELRGLETVAAAVNQSVTDEDLALALMGLGVYATDQPGSPIDPTTGETRDWFIYPGAVIENSKGLRKVEGVTSLAAYTEHLDRLFGYLQKSSGAVDAATGRVDVQVAESGVALLLELGPMLAKAEEKDRIITDVHTQMFYDLRAWLKVYEGVNLDDVEILPTFQDKLPTNRKAEVELVTTLMATTPPVLSAESARAYLAARGFEDMFAEDEAERVFAEMAQVATAQTPADALPAREAIEQPDGIGPQTDVAGSEPVVPEEGA